MKNLESLVIGKEYYVLHEKSDASSAKKATFLGLDLEFADDPWLVFRDSRGQGIYPPKLIGIGSSRADAKANFGKILAHDSSESRRKMGQFQKWLRDKGFEIWWDPTDLRTSKVGKPIFSKQVSARKYIRVMFEYHEHGTVTLVQSYGKRFTISGLPVKNPLTYEEAKSALLEFGISCG